MDGVRFVVDAQVVPLVEGLVFDVTNYWGRDTVMARHQEVKGCD